MSSVSFLRSFIESFLAITLTTKRQEENYSFSMNLVNPCQVGKDNYLNINLFGVYFFSIALLWLDLGGIHFAVFKDMGMSLNLRMLLFPFVLKGKAHHLFLSLALLDCLSTYLVTILCSFLWICVLTFMKMSSYNECIHWIVS